MVQGLLRSDKIVRFGSINASNHDNLRAVAQEVQKNENVRLLFFALFHLGSALNVLVFSSANGDDSCSTKGRVIERRKAGQPGSRAESVVWKRTARVSHCADATMRRKHRLEHLERTRVCWRH